MELSTILVYTTASLLVVVFGAWLAVTFYLHRLHKKYAHIPSPKMPSFYLGHSSTIQALIKDELPYHDAFFKWYEECGPVFVIFIVHFPLVVTMNPDDIKKVMMQQQLSKPLWFYSQMQVLLGERLAGQGLVSVRECTAWKPKRKRYEPAFHKNYLKSLVPTFNEYVGKLVEKLRPLADGKTHVPMKKELSMLIVSAVGKVAMDEDFGNQTWSDQELGLNNSTSGGTITFLSYHSLKGVREAVFNPLLQYWNRSEAESYRETARALRAIGRDIVLRKIKAINNGEISRDILSMMLQSASNGRDPVDLEDFVDDFVTFFIAGEETTTDLLSFTLIMLNQHPDILDRVVAEISEVVGDEDVVTAEDLERLQYLEQVLLEVLRLYPPGIGGARVVGKGLIFSGYEIPEGTVIGTSNYCLCRLPEHFEDPLVFDPNRFDPARKRPNPFVYFPFSVGPRSCIGKEFALTVAKIFLARLLKTFRFVLPEDYRLQLVWRTTLQPKGNLLCTVECI